MDKIHKKSVFVRLVMRAQKGAASLWLRYLSAYLHYIGHTGISQEPGLPRLRDKLFLSILLLIVPIGFLAYIPSIILSVKTYEYAVGIIDTLAMGVLFWVFFHRHMSMRVRKILFSVVIYLLGVILLISLGTMGPGMIILFSLSMLVTLVYSRQAGFFTVLLNALLYVCLLLLIHFDSLSLSFFIDYTLETWLVVGFNFVAFNAILVLSVSFLVDHLQRSLLKEVRLHQYLRHERANLLKAKEKAEESDHLKTVFLANMSHEIRTPMNGVLGFSRLLKRDELSREKQQEYIEAIEESGERMLHLLNGLVDIAKIEAGQAEVYPVTFLLRELMKELYGFFQWRARQKNLEFNLVQDFPTHQTVTLDKGKVEQICYNLLGNALKFTHSGTIELGVKQQDSELLFWVSDTGSGIEEAQQELIFQRFRQGHESHQVVHDGVGLGLAIARSFVELMKGRLWVESTPGKGATFYFALPFQSKP
ncbi:MAG: ATP-binding protein [Bacteroidales bacterium]